MCKSYDINNIIDGGNNEQIEKEKFFDREVKYSKLLNSKKKKKNCTMFL